ncbi:MAG: MBL fold metallo-hydrolase [Longimicrobiales bacterium]|nr:MBL fold metallo-hydrolase [Longimicrobiales bacterium]
MASHIRALSAALSSATEIRILLTHGHRDHSGASCVLAQQTGGTLLAPASYRPPEGAVVTVGPLKEGDRVPTDQGTLVALEVPGHTRDHLAFHWEEGGALFVGDLLLGRGNTTWIGEYLGCVEDYLASLDKVEAMGVSVLYPSHGPPIRAPSITLERFRRHRLDRVEEVRTVREEHPEASPVELAALIYGREIPPKLVKAAKASVEAALFHLDRWGPSD